MGTSVVCRHALSYYCHGYPHVTGFLSTSSSESIAIMEVVHALIRVQQETQNIKVLEVVQSFYNFKSHQMYVQRRENGWYVVEEGAS